MIYSETYAKYLHAWDCHQRLAYDIRAICRRIRDARKRRKRFIASGGTGENNAAIMFLPAVLKYRFRKMAAEYRRVREMI